MAQTIEEASESDVLPGPLVEEPPYDRWCDVVMKGGVASGIVYPWALLEIARRYRFRNLGGTSVGAMAAAIAAACEYGRRRGNPSAYEVLRFLPSELAKQPDGDRDYTPKRTVMLSLFQPVNKGKRLFRMFTDILNVRYSNNGKPARKKSKRSLLMTTIKIFYKHYFSTSALAIFVLVAGLLCLSYSSANTVFTHKGNLLMMAVISIGLPVVLVVIPVWRLAYDIRNGIIKNDLGLCRGSSENGNKDSKYYALVEWIHDAIQTAAGLSYDKSPLTFEDLWHAPLWPGGCRPQLDKNDIPIERSINLEMVTTNVTQGRPYCLPLDKKEAKLFFNPDEWSRFFPVEILEPLCKASVPYKASPAIDSAKNIPINGLLELPCGKLPIVVAARLSLSYPLLFSALPLYAIDSDPLSTEKPRLRSCRFSDGGLCSNFPIHFFDSALPRWPTFGLSLEERRSSSDNAVWLPKTQNEGQTDSWNQLKDDDNESFWTHTSHKGTAGWEAGRMSALLSFLSLSFRSAKDWRDMTTIKMPHVRRRVVRLRLISREGEGQLNIAMPRAKILHMAKTYGTEAGKRLCDQYAPCNGSSQPRDAWQEHLWVRLQVLLDGVSKLLKNVSDTSTSKAHTLDTRQLLQLATQRPPVADNDDKRKLSDIQRNELHDLMLRITELEETLSSIKDLPHKPQPSPELRLRPTL